ncbi:MAG: AraC family transcriptional regulator [Paenibacillus sp.]|nr:AraC family transcriptional regulator [Paenibacillus sp.]
MRIFGGNTVITSIESVFINNTSEYAVFENRPFHGFIYKTEGSSQYAFNGKLLELETNGLMYLPKNSGYVIRADNGGNYMVINFDFLSQDYVQEPTKIVFNDHANVFRLFQQIRDCWVLKSETNLLQAKSLLYQIMAEISRQQEAAYISPVAKEKISAATEYLRRHLYDTDLRVSDLYELLGMSDTYFGRLFRQVYFMTPIQYINRERIEQAKSLLKSGEFHTVEQVAHAVGFSDLFYFCKVFKNISGKTPTAWRQTATTPE